MTLVRANMSFYHDAVGTKAHNEMFVIHNAEVLAQLEKAGYVTKVQGEEQQQYAQMQEQELQARQKSAQDNEAVSLAKHIQNVQANAHSQNVAQLRQKAGTGVNMQAKQAQQLAKSQEEVAQQEQTQQETAQPKAQPKKAEKAEK